MADLADVKDYVFYAASLPNGGGPRYREMAEMSRDRWLFERMMELAIEHPHWDKDQRRDQAERDFDAAVREVEEEGP